MVDGFHSPLCAAFIAGIRRRLMLTAKWRFHSPPRAAFIAGGVFVRGTIRGLGFHSSLRAAFIAGIIGHACCVTMVWVHSPPQAAFILGSVAAFLGARTSSHSI